jgi:hypothetical protein
MKGRARSEIVPAIHYGGFAVRGAEMEELRRRVFSDPPTTVREARAILRRANRLYDETVAECAEWNVAFRAFNRAVQRLIRKGEGR